MENTKNNYSNVTQHYSYPSRLTEYLLEIKCGAVGSGIVSRGQAVGQSVGPFPTVCRRIDGRTTTLT